jgi:23S rRNA (cytidine2498-2'-O)-methyltransferase
MGKSDFIFATCRTGGEPSLKREVLARHGGLLTPAFMRPQLITFKAQTPLPADFELGAAFAPVSGFSIGMARTAAEVALRISEAGLQASMLHVFPRVIGEDGVTAEVWQRMDQIKAEVEQVCPLTAGSSGQVIDLILGEESEPWFVGAHRASAAVHPHPGAVPRITLPAGMPSRAWLKMEQSLAWLGLDAPESLLGKSALELGSAPGGAAWSLLQRGMKVIGVDTGAMDERVLNHPRYDHIGLAAGEVPFDYLPERVDLLISDMNLAPDVALRLLEPFEDRLKPRWLILTMKMNDAGIEAQLPALIERVRSFTSGPVYAKQLHANRREVTVISQRA